jgi:thiamine-monophosphate kinase
MYQLQYLHKDLSRAGTWNKKDEIKLKVKPMHIKEVGELDIIRNLFSIFAETGEEMANLYPFDDCAIMDLGEHYLVLTTDMINEKTHIPEGATGYQIGWFLMAVNLSDLAAKGAVPMGFLNALGLPSTTDMEMVEDIARGIAACGRANSCPVVGGDTKYSGEMTLTGMAFGTVLKDRLMPRIGCKPGDILAVTGDMGRASYGLKKLEDMRYINEHEIYKELFLQLIMEVRPQLLAGQMLAKLSVVNACIDLSDGLALSLHQLKELNQVGFNVHLDKLPVVPMLQEIEADLTVEELEDMLFYTGGDYELLVTMDKMHFQTAKTALDLLDMPLTAIGRVEEGMDIIMKTPGGDKPLEYRGFDAFKAVG